MWVRTVNEMLLNLNYCIRVKVVGVAYGGAGAPIARWEIRAYMADSDKVGQVLYQEATEEDAIQRLAELHGELSTDSPRLARA